MAEEFLNEPKVAVWKKTLEENRCTINRIEPLSLYYRRNKELLFALLHADVTGPEGYTIPPIIFIRGHAVIVVPLLTNTTTGEERFLMVRQRRIATGAPTLEFPAGMLDRDIDAPGAVAVKELREETGLEIPEEALFPLARAPLYTSPGASDEGIYYYGCSIERDDADCRRFEGRVREDQAADEYVQVTLKTREEAAREITTLPALLGLHLFEDLRARLRSEGNLP